MDIGFFFECSFALLTLLLPFALVFATLVTGGAAIWAMVRSP